MNKTILNLFTSLALAAPTLLGAGVASAQWQSPQSPPFVTVDSRPAPELHRRPTMPVIARPVAVRKVATVATINYRGRAVSGMTLTDGSTVLLARPNRALAWTLRPGALVRVTGVTMPFNPQFIHRASVTALRAPAAAAAPRPFAMQGTVRSVALGVDGRPDAIRLSNGTRIVVPDSLARSVGTLHRGQRIAVTGHRAGAGPNAPFIANVIVSTSGFAFNAR